MNLPPPLAPWGQALDLFPHELAVPLGAILRPLDALVGPLRVRPHRDSDEEPDGYRDIARRGPYERLLLSEWLLAAEEPDEWTRRAVAGEHTFLELSRRKPAADRLSAVLFDTGPSQWGAPRLAHLVALLVLQRRARAAGARFTWGILQHSPPAPEAPLWSEVTESGILRLTQGAAAREATEAELDAWRQRLAPDAGEAPGKPNQRPLAPELWIVGGARLAPFADRARASLLSIREPATEDDAHAPAYLIANARFGADATPRAIASDVRLPLPEPSVCIRLLRDPFGGRSHAPAGAAAGAGRATEAPRDTPISDLAFALHGAKLFARGAAQGGGTLLGYPLGNSPAANVTAPPKQYRSQFGTPFFAAGRIGRTTALVSLSTDGATVRVETFGKGGGIAPGAYRLTSPVRQPARTEAFHPLLPLYRGVAGAIEELVTALPDGQIVTLRHHPTSGNTARVMDSLRALALCRAADGVLIAGLMGKDFVLTLMRDAPASDVRFVMRSADILDTPSDDYSRVALRAFLSLPTADGPVVVQRPDEPHAGTLLQSDTVQRLAWPVEQRLVAVGGNRDNPGQPVLYLLSADGATLSTALAERSLHLSPLLRSPGARFTRVAVSPYAPLVAYATEAGDVGVWSLDYQDYVYRRPGPSVQVVAP